MVTITIGISILTNKSRKVKAMHTPNQQIPKVPSERLSKPVDQSRMLILGNDPVFSNSLKGRLLHSFPSVEIETCQEPTTKAGYDVYFIENDPNCTELEENQIKAFKSLSPDAIVVCVSETLTPAQLVKLVNIGCNLVYKKGHLENSSGARNMIDSIQACSRKSFY